MNKYIKTDLEQAVSYMKTAILNAIYDIDSGEEKEINMGPYLSVKLAHECLISEGWLYEGQNMYSNYYTSPKSGTILSIIKDKHIIFKRSNLD